MLKSTLLALVLATGCYEGEVQYAGPVTSGPDLAYVAPGVRVITDYDQPIFFAEGAYWWFYDGFWYRSTAYTGGWVYVPSPPRVVVSIGDPWRFVDFRPHGYVAHYRPIPSHRIQRPMRSPRAERPRIRDHRR